jgi:BMFP domain-containing protein YqiC
MLAKEKVFDDIARVAGGTIGVFSGLSQQVKQEIRARADELALRFDLVPREDFERLEAMLREAREEQTRQNARLEALEKQLGASAPSPKSKNKE